MKRSLVICVIFILCLAGFFIIKEKRIESDKKFATEIVREYYNNILSKNYDKALGLIYYENDKLFQEDVENMGNFEAFTLKAYSDNPNWVLQVEYDKRTKSYLVKSTGMSVYQNEIYNFFENIYVKKIENQFKISKIDTDDKFYYIRGSQIYRNK